MIISKEHFAPATTPKKDISFPAILRPFKCDHLVRLGQDYDLYPTFLNKSVLIPNNINFPLSRNDFIKLI